MRKVALLAAIVLALGACGGDDTEGSEAFCEATRTVIELGNVDAMPPEVDTMVEEAPEEIKDATETIRDSFQEMFQNQDATAIQTEEFEAAAAEVRAYATENCEGVTDITE